MLRPILFNTEMVKAIQDGRKTATRRVIRWDRNDVIKVASARGKVFGHIPEDKPIPEQLLTWYINSVLPRPYQVGDVLWVRECWDFLPCVICRSESECCEFAPDAPDQMETADGLTDGCFLYKALDGGAPLAWEDVHKWQPSIHMPKAAARNFLHVTSIFAVDLQGSINKVWCPALELQGEGIDVGDDCRSCIETYGNPACISESGDPPDDDECGLLDDPRGEFAEIWDSTIQKDRLAAEGWAANPWVWVIRFERIEKPAGWPEA